MYSTTRAIPRLARRFGVSAAVSGRLYAATAIRPSSSSSSSRPSSRPPPPPLPFELVPTCPSPTCECAATPEMPEGLPIDHKSPLNGVVSAYAEQVLVCTGKDDWVSRIEEEDGGDNLAADLKELFGRGGTYSDPWHNISVLNASFPSSVPQQRSELQTTSAYLVPSFKYVPFLPRVSFDSVRALAEGYLLPEKLHPMNDGLSPVHRDRLTRKEAYRALLYGVRDVEDVLVLICGHGGRDMRCGVIGPVLRDEFERSLEAEGVVVQRGAVEVDEGEGEKIAAPAEAEKEEKKVSARVGLISHIGGHKFAGNVIVYVPPGLKTAAGEKHPLAGKGIWYGRVEPKHVEGIVRETVLGGRVIQDMFRGGIDENRRILRM
ncbi:Altered inheritance of mitochondria protein 32 [Colletotrichum plurivorum]|uniref:Altered inheritance of mitochondria protein 32 n=1 Tax=Colletotrichum plurivorum TaxID=2175906 RepID=A0A8H6NS93_9PEZI|nr:Altered inheritance of mitochondria protein 32 [Colletotrichum plurivorum]